MSNTVQNIIDFIGSRGVTNQKKFVTFFLYWLNWVSLLTAIGSFSIFLFTFVYDVEGPIWFYRFITLLVSVFYLLIVILHHFNKLELAFLHFAIIVPWWYAIAIVVLGGNFSQSIAAASTLVVILFIYPKRDRFFYILIVYNILLFVLPSFYVSLKGPVIGVNFPFDEIVVFLLCCGWVSIAFISFDRSRSTLIKDLKSNNSILNARTKELHQFSYLMAHDIKTPIRNIVSFLGLLDRSLKANNIEKAQQHLDYALKGSMDLNNLVTDVSKVIELRGDEEVKDIEMQDLDNILETTLFSLKNQIDVYQGEVKHEPLGQYTCNPADMTLLFQNLIINGLKYNQSTKPCVEVKSVNEIDKKVLLFVDNGIGIEKEYQDKIFDFFQRLHVKSEYEGTGIGLGICNYIVSKYNGQINVESIIGEGSTFRVELPF